VRLRYTLSYRDLEEITKRRQSLVQADTSPVRFLSCLCCDLLLKSLFPFLFFQLQVHFFYL